MKIVYSNKKFSPILCIIIVLCFMITCSAQKERLSRWDLDTDFELMKNLDGDSMSPERILCPSSNSLEECEDERENSFMQLRKRQPTHTAALIPAFTATKSDKTIRTVPFFQSSQSSCFCDMEHRLLDLGLPYYPRYVPTAICKPGGCQGGPFRCHPKKYKVKVLKQKQLEEKDLSETNQAALPQSLRDLFMSETISVTVACECGP